MLYHHSYIIFASEDKITKIRLKRHPLSAKKKTLSKTLSSPPDMCAIPGKDRLDTG